MATATELTHKTQLSEGRHQSRSTADPDEFTRFRQHRVANTKDAAESINFISRLASLAATKLNERIARGQDTSAFLIALLFAGFKDLADILTFTLAGYLLIFVDLFLMYFLFRKGWFLQTQARVVWRVGLWIAGMILDDLPIIEAAPITIIMVLLAWRNVRNDAEIAETDLSALAQKTEEELRDIAESEGENEIAATGELSW